MGAGRKGDVSRKEMKGGDGRRKKGNVKGKQDIKKGKYRGKVARRGRVGYRGGTERKGRKGCRRKGNGRKKES